MRTTVCLTIIAWALAGCAHGGATKVGAQLNARVLTLAEVAAIRVGDIDVPGVEDAESTLMQALPALSRTASTAWQLDVHSAPARRLGVGSGQPQVGQFQSSVSGLDSSGGRNVRGPAFNRAGTNRAGRTRDGVLLRAQLRADPQAGVEVWQGALWVPRAAFKQCGAHWLGVLAKTLGETVQRELPAHCPGR